MELPPNFPLTVQDLALPSSLPPATATTLAGTTTPGTTPAARTPRTMGAPGGSQTPLPDYDFAPHYLPLTHGRLHYIDEGTGDPVVMLHGNPNWSYYYRHLVHALRDRYRCIVPDHVGCGFSDFPSETQYSYRFSQRVDDLAALFDQLKLTSRVTLVVHDWGGMIGSAYAVRYPERIARLVVLNTGAFSLPKSKRVPWQLRLARVPLLGALLVRGLSAFSRGAVRQCMTRHVMPTDVARAYCAPYSNWSRRLAVHRFVQDIPLGPSHPSWELVQQTSERLSVLEGRPLFIGWGARDFVFDSHFLEEWARRFPAAEIHRFADCGHYVLEDAREELIPLIREFLLRHPIG